MKTLLLATQNPGKVKELKIGLKDLIKKGLEVISLKDLKIRKEVEETGKTFQENALIKAKFYADLTGYPAIGDDGGLTIPFLNDGPGVKSRRWLGRESTDKELIDYCLYNLRGCTGRDRTAYLWVCLCFFDPVGRHHDICIYSQEKVKGHIAYKPSSRRLKGYPFRSLFIVEKFNKYYDELTDCEHEKINHRLIALNTLINKINLDLLE